MLELALVRWALELLGGHGFVPVVPPVLVREEALYGTGMLPDTEQQIYRVPDDGLYLAGTSEVPLASLHGGEMLAEDSLPLRYAGLSTCFRREAGAAGKDTRGIFRVHQFDKVEMFTFVTPRSRRPSTSVCCHRGGAMQALELPYRVVNIAVDDLGASASKKYDIEVWLPGQERFRELTSCSNTTDYQARRLDVRYRPGRRPAPRRHPQRHGGGGGTVMIALAENGQQDDGSVALPAVLREFGLRTGSSRRAAESARRARRPVAGAALLQPGARLTPHRPCTIGVHHRSSPDVPSAWRAQRWGAELVAVLDDQPLTEPKAGAHVVVHVAAGLGERVVGQPAGAAGVSPTRGGPPVRSPGRLAREVSMRHMSPGSSPRRSVNTGSEKWASGA